MLVRRLQSKKETVNPSNEVHPDIKRFQEDLSEKLGAKVVIQHTNKGKGKLMLHYNSLDELEGILAHIK